MKLNEFLEWIEKEGKMEVLQEYTDKICRKQRELCNELFCQTWQDVDKEDSKDAYDTFCQWYKWDILYNTEQPKIEDLL